MKTISIKGKPYVMVNERVKEFRENQRYAGYALITEIVSVTENSCIMKAIIKDYNGNIVATGIAQEDRDNALSMVNKTSYIENCETSAWGRALANLGIGIDESIASSEEVVNAIAGQQGFGENEPDLDTALNHKTTKGVLYMDLDNDKLQWIVDNRPNSFSAKCAKVVLDYRADDETAPF